MRHRRFVMASTLVMLAVAAASGAALYWSHTVRAFSLAHPEALTSLPADCQFVFGANVRKLVASPFYAQARQGGSLALPLGGDLGSFIEATGVDPSRDVTSLVAGGRSTSGAGRGVVIVDGSFDTNRISAYIRSKWAPAERQYRGVSMFLIPDGHDGAERGVALLSSRQVVAGDLELLRSVLDTRAGQSGSILQNASLYSLIGSVNTDAMLWFAGNAAGVLSRAPLNTPLGPNIGSIQNVTGSLDITNAVVGTVTAQAASAEAASKLADVLRGFLALGQLSGDQNPDLKSLLGGLSVTQEGDQVRLSLNLPLDLLQKLRGPKAAPGRQ